MVAALGVVGHGKIAHVAAGGLAEPDGAQIGLQARLAVQNAGQLHSHDAALRRALGAQGDLGVHRHRVAGAVGVPAHGVAGAVRTAVVRGHDDLIVSVLCIGIGIAVGQCAGPDRAVGRGDLKLGSGDPVGQDELRHGIGEGAQLLHGQVRRAFVGLVDLIAQHRDDPAPAVGLEGLLTEGDSLLRQGIRPGAAVKKSRRSAQDGGNHNDDHHKPKQQFTHIVFSPWQYGIAKKPDAVRSVPSRVVVAERLPTRGKPWGSFTPSPLRGRRGCSRRWWNPRRRNRHPRSRR